MLRIPAASLGGRGDENASQRSDVKTKDFAWKGTMSKQLLRMAGVNKSFPGVKALSDM